MVTIQEIKEILKKRHITYQQLSDKTGISLGALKAIFRGQTLTPRIDTLEAILKALDVDVTLPTDDGLTIPENLQNIRFAFHDGLDGLTQEDRANGIVYKITMPKNASSVSKVKLPDFLTRLLLELKEKKSPPKGGLHFLLSKYILVRKGYSQLYSKIRHFGRASCYPHTRL